MLVNNFGINNRGISYNHFCVKAIMSQVILIQKPFNAGKELHTALVSCHLINHNEDMLYTLSDAFHPFRNDLALFIKDSLKNCLQMAKRIFPSFRLLERLNSDSSDNLILLQFFIFHQRIERITDACQYTTGSLPFIP